MAAVTDGHETELERTRVTVIENNKKQWGYLFSIPCAILIVDTLTTLTRYCLCRNR